MKFLIVRTYPSVINIDTYNVQEIGLAKAMVKKNIFCDVVLFTNGKSCTQDLESDGRVIKIYWIHGVKVAGQGIYNNKELLNIAKRYDVIQVNEYNQIASFFLAKMLNRKCYIYHGPYENKDAIKYNVENKIFDFIYLKKYRKLDPLIIAKSKLAEEFLHKKGFVNIQTVGVGLDKERFSVNEGRINLKKEGYRLLYIGELSERRNSLFLLDVLKRIIDKIGKGITLTIVGNGKEEYVNRFNSYAFELGIDSNLVHIGKVKQENLAEFYQTSDLFVFPTNYDIFGMVLLEAMYFGVPIVSSLNGGSKTIFSCGEVGCILNSFDTNEWANSIIDLLRDKKLRNKISIDERQCFVNNFTWDRISEKIINYVNMNLDK